MGRDYASLTVPELEVLRTLVWTGSGGAGRGRLRGFAPLDASLISVSGVLSVDLDRLSDIG